MIKLLIAALFLSSLSWARVQTYTFDGKKFSVDLPKDWEGNKNLLGLPVSFIAPMQKDGTRPVVGLVTPGPKAKDVTFAKDPTEKALKEYKEMKTTWARDNAAKIADFLPPSEKKTKQGRVLTLGYRYEKKGRRYTERNFYILCGKQFYFAVGLVSAPNESYTDDMDHILGSLKCF